MPGDAPGVEDRSRSRDRPAARAVLVPHRHGAGRAVGRVEGPDPVVWPPLVRLEGEPMTEAEFQKQVLELADTAGYRVNHCYRGKVAKGAWRTNTTVKGWPDLTFFRPGDFFFAELKVDDGELSGEQETVIAELRASGVDVYVWSPAVWQQVIERLVAL
jgi:hypothetical protein